MKCKTYSIVKKKDTSTWVGKKMTHSDLNHSSALHYAIAWNFGRNTTSISLNSNWYNLASMIKCNVF